MPSVSLTVHARCYYLTDIESGWRNVDYITRGVVKSFKGEPWGGYINIDGTNYTQEQSGTVRSRIIPGLARFISEQTADAVTLVPVPNSNAAVDQQEEYRTLALARAIAAELPDERALARDALRWRTTREPQHRKSGQRHASHHIPDLVVRLAPRRPIVLVDDVLTSGSQMLACAHVLRTAGCVVRFGVVVGRRTEVQHDEMIGWTETTVEQFIP